MRTARGFLRRPEFHIAAAFPAGSADKLIAGFAQRQPPGVLLRCCLLRRRKRRDTLLDQLVQLTFVRLLQQAAEAWLAFHHSVRVISATEQGGIKAAALPSAALTVSGFIVTLSGSSKVLCS